MSRNNGAATAAPAQINPSAVYAELRNRLQNADYFGRITLAAKLLNHRPWVVAPDGGGGDVSTAIDRLVYCGNAALGAQVGAIAEAAGKPFEMVAA
jgi:hypothetical protein